MVQDFNRELDARFAARQAANQKGQQMEMEKFKGIGERCPKCASSDIKRMFHEAVTEEEAKVSKERFEATVRSGSMALLVAHPKKAGPAHLLVSCDRCGATWKRAPLDAKSEPFTRVWKRGQDICEKGYYWHRYDERSTPEIIWTDGDVVRTLWGTPAYALSDKPGEFSGPFHIPGPADA